LSLFFLLAGFALLIKGADWLVDGAAALAEKYGIPDIVVGLTIVAFGTSAPELVVNLIASFKGNSEIAMGNVLGSNMANILLILGVTGLLTTIKVARATLLYEIPYNFFVTVVLGFLAYNFFGGALDINRLDGLVLIFLFGIFWMYTLRLVKGSENQTTVEIESHNSMANSKALIKIAGGVLGLFLGGNWLVKGAVAIAIQLHVSEGLIGITVVAIGTSLPELAASIAASRRGKIDFIMGNVIGSNLFNILWVLGISSIIRPIPYNTASNLDIFGNLFAGALLFGVLLVNKLEMSRKTGLLFLLLYVGYILLSVKMRSI